jgi:hypothetical protein
MLVCAIFSFKSYGQTWNEIFRQKKTQQKYLLEQLAALEVYAGYLKKGYEISRSGLSTIKDLSGGEFKLHEIFIMGLKKVNPVIAGSSKVAEIIKMQLDIGKAFGNIISSEYLSFSDRLYVRDVRENLWEESLVDLEELLLVVSSSKVEMSDDQRVERLDKIYSSMKEISAFVQYFTGQVNLLAVGRELEKSSIEHIRRYYGH